MQTVTPDPSDEALRAEQSSEQGLGFSLILTLGLWGLRLRKRASGYGVLGIHTAVRVEGVRL